MIRKILSQFAGQTTNVSTPVPSTSSSVRSTASAAPSYDDMLGMRQQAVRWYQQAERVLELLEAAEKHLAQLVVDRRVAHDLKQAARLATLDSDRLEEEARHTALQNLLLQLTGSTQRTKADALVRQVRVALRVTYELENAWLQLEELVTVGTINGTFDEPVLSQAAAEDRTAAARLDFFTSVAQLVLHLAPTSDSVSPS